jgi:hypothetical protein
VKPLYLAIFVFVGMLIVMLMSSPIPTTTEAQGKLIGDAMFPAFWIWLGAEALEKKKVKTDDLLAVPPKKEGGHLK